jgi:hypothetical protein
MRREDLLPGFAIALVTLSIGGALFGLSAIIDVAERSSPPVVLIPDVGVKDHDEPEPDYQGATECFPDWEPYYKCYLRSSAAYVARYHSPAGRSSDGELLSHMQVEELHDATGAVPHGSIEAMRLPPEIAAKSDRLFLGGPMGRKTGDIFWNTSDPVSAEFVQFLRDMPDRECPDLARWTYAVGFVGQSDQLIVDAIREILMGGHDEPIVSAPGFREFAEALRSDSLRQLLMDPDSTRQQQAMAALLLGFCGDDQDEPLLRQLVLQLDGRRIWDINYPTMSGYYILTKGAGVGLLAKERLENPSTRVRGHGFSIDAIRFAVLRAGNDFDRDPAIHAIRPLVQDEHAADDAIAALTDLKDWESMDEVVERFDSTEGYVFRVRELIVRYLLAAIKDESNSANRLSPRASAAKKHLEALRPKDPKVFEHVGVCRRGCVPARRGSSPFRSRAACGVSPPRPGRNAGPWDGVSSDG